MLSSKRNLRKRRLGLVRAGLLVALCVVASAAVADCLNSAAPYAANYAPASGDTVICDTSAPNPLTSTGVLSAAGSDGVNITVEANAGITPPSGVPGARVNNNSTVTNNGYIDTHTGAAYAYGIWAGDSGNATSASAGYGNTITNNGRITTVAAGSTGIYLRSRHASIGNAIVNPGTIATSGTVSASRASSGIRIESRDVGSTINNSGSITASGPSGNGIEVNGMTSITNTGTIASVQGCGIVGSELVQSTTLRYDSITLDNAGTISGADCAISLDFGADTVTLHDGSVLTGYIDGGGVSLPYTGQDQLIFDGFTSIGFGNTITRFNLLQARGNADVVMTSVAGYGFDQMEIDSSSALAFINTTLTASPDIANHGSLAFNSDQSVASLLNSGAVYLSDPAAAGTLLTIGDYTGGGDIFMHTTLEVGQPTDQIVITGAVVGTTALHITSLGGAGVPAGDDGILVIEAAAASDTSFTLATPLAAGGKQYELHRGDLAGGNLPNWYLRPAAVVPVPTATAVPALHPAALALLALALGWLGSRLAAFRAAAARDGS